MSVQFIEEKGRPAFAVVPYADWLKLQEALEDKIDIEAVRRSIDANEDAMPMEVLERLLAGENKVKVHREWRGLTQEELAVAVGTATAYVSQIETGNRNPGNAMRQRLAEALRVEVQDLV